jgi:signal transduction histidine kinase
MAPAIREGRAFRNLEVVIERPDGSRISTLVNIDPLLDEAGRVVGAVNVVHDVSALKAAEQSVREAEVALREADRRKDEFLATLAHELRNPLAPIRNGLDVVRLSDHSAHASRVYQVIESQVGHMMRLVDDLLELSRISRGTIKPVNLETVRALLAGTADRAGRQTQRDRVASGRELVDSRDFGT